jgi:hypothetical protein
MSITIQPRLSILNGVSFTDAQIAELGTFFLSQTTQVPKDLLRESQVLQMAMASGAVVSNQVDTGNDVILYLTQEGAILLGVDYQIDPIPGPVVPQLTEDEILHLKELFYSSHMLVMTNVEVRADQAIRDALHAHLIASVAGQTSSTVVLNLTQAGRAVLEI